jgi:hypothetical protein
MSEDQFSESAFELMVGAYLAQAAFKAWGEPGELARGRGRTVGCLASPGLPLDGQEERQQPRGQRVLEP